MEALDIRLTRVKNRRLEAKPMNPVDLDLLCSFLPFAWMRVVYNTENKCVASDATRRSMQGLLMAGEQKGRHRLFHYLWQRPKAADSDLIKLYKHDTIILKR